VEGFVKGFEHRFVRGDQFATARRCREGHCGLTWSVFGSR
jgi:hypothetical protein